jgi:hypothetical protein
VRPSNNSVAHSVATVWLIIFILSRAEKNDRQKGQTRLEKWKPALLEYKNKTREI